MSRYTFKVGDRVRIIRSVDGSLVGRLATVSSELGTIFFVNSNEFLDGHSLDVDGVPVGDGELAYGAPPSWLEPYRDDNNEPAENVEAWIADLCKRKEVSRV